MLRTVFLSALSLCFAFGAAAQTLEIPNPLIDSKGFMRDTTEAYARRTKRRVTEKQFLKMAKDKGTKILDTRSAKKFKLLHVAGAVHLNFSDMTQESLAESIGRLTCRLARS